MHNSEKRWAQRLNKIGIATFSIDSNKGRRCGNNCYADHQGFPNMVDGYRALELLSSHPNILCEFIEKNINENWDWSWYGFSRNENITCEFIERHIDKKWNLVGLSWNEKITYKFFEKYF